MRGPAVNLVVLALLVLFVGIQHRARPLAHTRLWFAGWASLFVSMVLWEFHLAQPVRDVVREAVRFDFILLTQLLFLISLLATVPRLWQVVRRGAFVGLPAVMAFNAYIVWPSTPHTVLVAAVVLWQIAGLFAMRRLIPKAWRVRRVLILCICAGYGAAFVAHLLWANTIDIQDWSLAEIAISSAVLYGADHKRRSIASLMGSLGFFIWACFYLLDSGTDLVLLTGPLQWVATFWDVPKFLVGASMILQMADDTREETAQIAERYRELYEDFHLMYERNPHPMWIYDETTSRFVSANRAAQKVYGYNEAELLHMDVREVLADPDPPGQDHAYGPPVAMAAVLGEPVRQHHRLRDSRTIAVDVTEHRILFQGNAARFVMAVDVTEMERESRDLLYRANHDALTGLPNRTQLDVRIDACLERSVRDECKALLLTIDIDYFKLVNDTHGHLVGDECLKAVAARLQSRIRQVDTLARTGGEEFTAIIGGLNSLDDAPRVAATLLKVFAEPLALTVGEMHLTVSIGGAIFPDDGMDRETLLRRSDEALYAAKRQGRNRAVFAPRVERTLEMELSTAKLDAGAGVFSGTSV